jgi:hypothetical protein
MSKTFTQRALLARDFACEEDYNEEARAALAEFNGQLSPEQLPYGTFDATRFTPNLSVDGLAYTEPDGTATGLAVQMPTQFYAVTQSDITDFNGYSPPDPTPLLSTGILGPAQKTYDTNSNDWQPGWNKASDYINKGVYLSIPAREGMLKGCAVADLEFYFGDQSVYGLGSALSGGAWRHEIGVFVDDVLVARSGKMPGRRHSYCLPFAIPVPGRRIIVDVRWRANFDGAGTSLGYAWVSNSSLKITNTILYVRNQYR